MILLDLGTFLGRLHPLVVHLPIGFLLLAGIFHLATYFPKYDMFGKATELSLLLGGLSGVSACILGWILSNSGDYAYQLLENHKLSGIGLTVLSLLLFFFLTDKGKSIITLPKKVLSVLFLSIIGLMSYAGHQGGNLTHGTEYLTLATLTETKREIPEKIEDVLIFEDLVQPILDKKCTQCHQSGKKKGELVLSSYEDIMKGGKNGAVLNVGNIDESELIRRVTLEKEHEEFMPTDGKTPLTEGELAILKWWINNEAVNKDISFLSLESHGEVLDNVEVYLGYKKAATGSDSHGGAISETYNPNIPTNVDLSLLPEIEKGGFTYRVMNHEPLMLDIAIDRNRTSPKIDLKELLPLAKNIIWLNLTDAAISSADFESLSQMENLEKLKLNGTKIDDESLKNIAPLKYLNALNLNDTQVSDKALEVFKDHKGLKHIYVWRTKVNKEAADKFNKENSGIEIIL
ncbi:c-type cytochrome domain-containing protein [uncultured Arcticibacterium sp.]|uniref:c-type cytochrome domain-containing protein n=1 Tax=uncultured Arcticibacterium sp. TaxID=2173042 RepID=UPI0030F600D8